MLDIMKILMVEIGEKSLEKCSLFSSFIEIETKLSQSGRIAWIFNLCTSLGVNKTYINGNKISIFQLHVIQYMMTGRNNRFSNLGQWIE